MSWGERWLFVFFLYWWNCWPSQLHFLSITCYDFRIKMMFGSSLPTVVCRRLHVFFTLFVFVCELWCPTHIVLCFLFCLSWSCVPNVASFSGFSMLNCPFGFLLRLCTCMLKLKHTIFIVSYHISIFRNVIASSAYYRIRTIKTLLDYNTHDLCSISFYSQKADA